MRTVVSLSMEKNHRRIIQKADKHVRNRDYPCLFPECKNKAIWSHAIPRELCISALADSGVLYSRHLSLCGSITMTSPWDAPEIVETGVNHASVFRGYCQHHDHLLFRSAETYDRDKKHGMYIAQFLRALSVEFCRKRQVLDFYKKAAMLADSLSLKEFYVGQIEPLEAVTSFFKKLYLGNLFKFICGSDVDRVDYFCVPFMRNLQVSCAGCFDAVPGAFDSVIAYNLVSYPDMTILVLTVFNAVKHYLDDFILKYPLPKKGERLLNDIAFSHCEEPLLSARLWRSLSEMEQLSIRYSLRHPHYRTEERALRIIKLSEDDFASNRRPLTPAMLTRLPPNP